MKMKISCGRLLPMIGGALVLAGLPTDSSRAQDAVIEEIVVTGIRAAVRNSIEAKRANANIVDAISAEDVGKLPDRNIAEALQRVPGVAISRERGEGDFVSIRGLGPDFVRGTVNARTLTSGTESFNSTLNGGAASTTGRATNFDVLPSEIIDTLEVSKTASAEQVEGGIGGVVNIKTSRPLDLGATVSATVRGRYGDFSEQTDPSFAGLASWSNDRDWGALLSVSYSQRSIREDLGNSFGFANGSVFGGAFNTTIDTDGDGLGDTDPNTTFAPFSANPEIFLEERQRLTVNSALQWTPGEHTEIVFDAMWSAREVSSTQYGAIYSLLPNSQTGVRFCNAAPNADGSYTCPRARIERNTLVAFPVTTNIETFTDVRDGEDSSVNLGLNIEHEIGDWALVADLSYGRANGDIAYGRSVLSLANGVNPPATPTGNPTTMVRTVAGLASTAGGSVNFAPDVADSAFTDPGRYVIQQNELRSRENEDDEIALQLDAAWERRVSVLSAVKFGLRWASREKQFVEFTGNNSGRLNPVIATSIANATARAPGNYLNGGTPGLTPSELLFPNHAAVLGARGRGIALEKNTLGSFSAKEDTLAAYVQVDFEGDVAGFGLSGNAGVRAVRTASDVVGQAQQLVLQQQGTINVPVLTGAVRDFPFENSYTNILPSLNLRMDIDADVVGRLAWGRSLTRPEFEQLAPSLNIINPTNRIAAFGNPNLQPYLADNLDLGIEWYFSEASIFSVAAFYKQIDDYIVASTNTDVVIADVRFNSVSQPDNQGEASITGIEVGYTHNLDFLPAPFDGLGFIVNLTQVDAELKLNNGADVPFPGVSDLSVNAALFYDRGPVQARLAYSWRDEFLFAPADVFVNSQLLVDDYGQLDFSLAYAVSERFSAVFEIVNLSDQQERQFADSGLSSAGQTRPLSLGQVGRRFVLGVSARF